MSTHTQLQSLSLPERDVMRSPPPLVNEQNVLGALNAYSESRADGGFRPSYFGIEVTRHCNLACVMCPHPHFAAKEKGQMDVDLFRTIIRKIAPYAEVTKLHWIGEPLLHPHVVEMIRFARSELSGAIFMSTNATFLQGALADDIRTSGLTKIILSLDGMSAKSYGSMRVKGDFEKVFANIHAFVESVERRGGPLCEIQMIATRHNEHEVASFKKRWSGYKNVAVNVTWLTDWAGNISIGRTVSNRRNPTSLSEREACSDLWFKMQIAWTGDVYACCLDARGSILLGNIRDEGLEAIWHSKAATELRRQHLDKRYQGICQKCADWAKPQEYEFWYSRDEYQANPDAIWTAPSIKPGKLKGINYAD